MDFPSCAGRNRILCFPAAETAFNAHSSATSTPTSKMVWKQRVIIDRDTAARLGVAAADIDNALYDAFGQRQVSIMYRQLNQYHVVMEVAPEFSRSTGALQSIYVRASNGTPVPLAAFAHFGPSNSVRRRSRNALRNFSARSRNQSSRQSAGAHDSALIKQSAHGALSECIDPSLQKFRLAALSRRRAH